MSFKEISLIEPILRALESEGYTTPTPIQAQTIPVILQGRDVLGCAQTGTGKTAAFAIPILQRQYESKTAEGKGNNFIKALILTPTRELAVQIGDSFGAYGRHTGLRHTVIFGGVGQKSQEDALRRGVDILIATPGRLLDLMNQGFVKLSNLNCFVLDEADRMLDMGFIHDVKKVISHLPKQRQTLFFSATMPTEISRLADSILTNPVKVAVTPVSSTAEKIVQLVYFVEKNNKKSLLEWLLQDQEIRTALVFTRTKHGADRVTRDLVRAGIKSAAIHGNKAQNARQNALNSFKSGKLRVLVATDIAARGIDVEELTHVFNFDLPNIPETYVHRIGRTGRAGNSGIAISFCQTDEVPYLADIQKLTGISVPIVEDHPYAMPTPIITAQKAPAAKQKQSAPQQNRPARPAQTPRPPQQPKAVTPAQPRAENHDRPERNNGKQDRPQAQQPRQQAPGNRPQGNPVQQQRPHDKAKTQPNQRPGGQNPQERKATPQKGDQRNKPTFDQKGKPENGKPNGGNGAPRKKSNTPHYTISKPDNKWNFLNKRIEIKWDEED